LPPLWFALDAQTAGLAGRGRGYRVTEMESDPDSLFDRYTISDGGVSEANVRSNIENFVGSSQFFRNFILDSQKVSGLTPNRVPTVQLAFAPPGDVTSAVRAAVMAGAVNRFDVVARPVTGVPAVH
jgi:hypothetical protein